MTSTNPKVSVIILSFNQSEYIDEAIKSVLNQTYQNLEIIISDNGSTDSTQEIILSYMNDPRIIFLDHKENLSISLRQNQAANIATGEFISLLYADDYYLPSKIEHQVKKFIFHGYSKKYRLAFTKNIFIEWEFNARLSSD